MEPMIWQARPRFLRRGYYRCRVKNAEACNRRYHGKHYNAQRRQRKNARDQALMADLERQLQEG